MSLSEKELAQIVCECLDEFYKRRLLKLNGLKLKDTLKKKTHIFSGPSGRKSAGIVEGLLNAYMSSSDETTFGNAFFEPLAKKVSGGVVSPSEGVNVAIETERRYVAIAVKSGTSIFNADSRKRQTQNFEALRKRMLKLQKSFEPLVGYCYGNKKTSRPIPLLSKS